MVRVRVRVKVVEGKGVSSPFTLTHPPSPTIKTYRLGSGRSLNKLGLNMTPFDRSHRVLSGTIISFVRTQLWANRDGFIKVANGQRAH
jgi:hypothetical protein